MKYFLSLILFLGFYYTIDCQILFPTEEPETEVVNVESRAGTNAPCNTPSRRRGVCVPIRTCANLWELILKQASYQLSYPEIVYLRNSQCGFDGGVLVCCEQNQINTETAAPAPAPVTQAPSPSRPSNKNLLPTPDQCAPLGDRIFGGQETSLGEFPWMALIEYSKSDGTRNHYCSGSLISDRYVLTAAHCTVGKIPYQYSLAGVRLGEWDKTTDPDCEEEFNKKQYCASPYEYVSIEKTIVHPDYETNSVNQYNDIALLRLSRTVNFTRWIQPICLPSDEGLRNFSFLNYTLSISGWGKTEVSSASTKKLRAEVGIVPHDVCNSKYKNYNITVKEKQICAGGVKGIDTCNGDSGGPLIALTHSTMPHYIVAGIVSFGPSPCALDGWAGVYTKVGNYIDWITQSVV